MADRVVAGRYVVESELARGGMGIVLRVVDRTTGETLALKRSLADGTGDAQRNAALLEREYRTLVTLRHPRIIRVIDYGVEAEGAFYTMELLDGEDLRERSPLGWREVCANLRDVASSLALLHSRRLIHRDVSPGNIRLTSEGRAKLIDFGTLVSFGASDTIAGTPPCVPPEGLQKAELDHRLDLYSLGATAYYALTKRHAYPARTLWELDATWRRGKPAPPSTHCPDVPAELDELVLSLLSRDRTLRPHSAAEVIDRLGAIADLPPDEDDRVVQSYLVSRSLIGRDREVGRFASRLERARSGRGSLLLVAGPAGFGRTSLLERFAKDARMTGAIALTINARAHQRDLGVCQALAERLNAEVGGLAPGAGGLGAPTAEAFVARFVEVSSDAPVVVLVDDVHIADNDSLIALASLAKEAANHRLLVVATYKTDDAASGRPAQRWLRRGAGRISLRPFVPEQIVEFVHSLFGDVPSLRLLAAWLEKHTEGNPSLCAALVSHLVREGRIRYADGTWVLPHDFPTSAGSDAMARAARERIDAMRPELRRFAECLSAHPRSLDGDLARALTEGEPGFVPAHAQGLLEELGREGTLVGDHGRFAFARSHVRATLYSALDDDRRRRLHARAARMLARRTSGRAEEEFEIGRHLLLAGDRRGANARILASLMELTTQPDALVDAVPELSDLHREYRRIGGTEAELMPVTGALVVSGYYVDPTVHDDIGDATADLFHRRTGFSLATALAPRLGSYPAVTLGLAWGFSRDAWLERGPRVGLFGFLVHAFVGLCAARSAVAYLRHERGVHERLQRLLSAGKGLAPHNALRLAYDLIGIAFAEMNGSFGDAHDGYLDQLTRLPHVRVFSEESRHHYETGLLCSLGRCQLLQTGGVALETADRIDAKGGEHDRILAQFLRRSHHLYRGDTTEAESAAATLDVMAARYGYRWVPDVLEVLDLIPYHLSSDLLGLKRALHHTEGLVDLAPAFVVHRRVIEAMYEGHRGHPEAALDVYETLQDELRPFHHPLWSFAHAHRAECLNALGRWDEALTVCETALCHVGPRSRVYVVAYQQLEREAAIALAHLGETDEAARRLDTLLGLDEDAAQPLTVGLLHRDRARVAHLAGDRSGFEHHAARARGLFAATRNPALLAQARRLVELGTTLGGTEAVRPVDAGEGLTDARPFETEALPNTAAHRVLAHVVALAGASGGFLYLIDEGGSTLAAREGDDGSAPISESEMRRWLGSLPRVSDLPTVGGVPLDAASSDAHLFPLVIAGVAGPRVIAAVVAFDCGMADAIAMQDLSEAAQALYTTTDTVVEGSGRRGDATTQR